jgi:hypothetical protein
MTDPVQVPPPADDRAVLTLALGPKIYRDMAVNLVRSIRRWHPAPGMPVTIVTDDATPLPADLANVRLLVLGANELGVGFQTKLHLDRLAPARHTLFIDADCLLYEPLDRIFAQLKGRPVATVGGTISEGEWFGDIRALCRQLGVPRIPKFNGGLYYLEQGAGSAEIYRRARELAGRYDELGLVRLRGHPNDELILASAMALGGLAALPDDGSFMADQLACPGKIVLNVLNGRRELTNPPAPSPLHRPWYPFTHVRPAIVHFLGHFNTCYPYRTEAHRLRLSSRGWPKWAANVVAVALTMFPGWLQETAKTALRPIYNRLFGFRRLQPTERQA